MLDRGIFRFNCITITPNMNADLLEKNGCFQNVKSRTATVFFAKIRLGTALFDLRITARKNTIKNLELRMCDSITAQESLEEKYSAHNTFLKNQLGDNFRERLGRIEYFFEWGSICSYMDIKTGECVIEVEYL